MHSYEQSYNIHSPFRITFIRLRNRRCSNVSYLGSYSNQACSHPLGFFAGWAPCQHEGAATRRWLQDRCPWGSLGHWRRQRNWQWQQRWSDGSARRCGWQRHVWWWCWRKVQRQAAVKLRDLPFFDKFHHPATSTCGFTVCFSCCCGGGSGCIVERWRVV